MKTGTNTQTFNYTFSAPIGEVNRNTACLCKNHVMLIFVIALICADRPNCINAEIISRATKNIFMLFTEKCS